jgi:competence protein ComEC
MAHRQCALSTLATMVFGGLCCMAWSGSARAAAPKSLEIYFIDVEGGQSTLIVTPDRQALLIDAGFAGDGNGFKPGDPHQARDANRIEATARAAGVTKIDYLLMTHFHPDHDGGVTELSQLMPIEAFIDHGVPSPDAVSNVPDANVAFDAYAIVRGKARHILSAAGDHLPLSDIDVVVVSSAGSTITQPLSGAGAANSACQAHATPPRDPYENPRSTGILVRYGKFRFLDLGDLTGQPLFDLACPQSLIGPVDAYLVPHHGGADVDVPATFAAFKPRVALMNNGLTKGGAESTYQALHGVQGLQSVWQVDRSTLAAESNFPAEYIANIEEGTSYWIKLVANTDGSFRVFNQRTGRWKSYSPRSL